MPFFPATWVATTGGLHVQGQPELRSSATATTKPRNKRRMGEPEVNLPILKQPCHILPYGLQGEAFYSAILDILGHLFLIRTTQMTSSGAPHLSPGLSCHLYANDSQIWTKLRPFSHTRSH